MANFRDQFDDDHFLRLWWVQDGALAHTLLMVRDILMEMFQNRVIALHHDIEWPARSPDLTPCDFFLWGYIKCKIFATPPATVEVLKQRIREEFEELSRNRVMVRNAQTCHSLYPERWSARRRKQLNIICNYLVNICCFKKILVNYTNVFSLFVCTSNTPI